MNKKTVSISLPKFEGVELKNATVDFEKGVVVAEYGEEDIEEDAEKDISKIAVDFRSAIDYLLEDNHRLYYRTIEKHMSKIEAINDLIRLAEAWNSFDEFKPDWENREQYKWHPVFRLRDGKIEFLDTSTVRWVLDSHISSFSFKTPERAEQFGKQFIDLFRIVLTN